MDQYHGIRIDKAYYYSSTNNILDVWPHQREYFMYLECTVRLQQFMSLIARFIARLWPEYVFYLALVGN